jgi:putative addiction module CopG family antidote
MNIHGDEILTNVNLGAPYDSIIEKIIKSGYAGNRTEVIRQALRAYDKQLEEEQERILVSKKVEAAMADIKSGKAKTYTLEEVRERLAKRKSRR